MKIHPNSKLVMIGDSITDCGRGRPLGDSADESLGNGYVSLVNALIVARYPERCIRILNTGINGNTVRDLKARWRRDVLDLQPDWLSIMIGINDVWMNFDPWMGAERRISYEEYATTLEGLVRRTEPRLKGLVLMTPYYIEPDRSDPMRAMMDRYGDVVRQLAVGYGAVLVDTQAAFDEALKYLNAFDLAADRVHVNLPGHMILARTFLRAVGFRW